MTSKGQITKVASAAGVDARVVERDYVLVHVVALIATQDADRALVFKGGTSLRLLHFEDYRYSADLDFSVIGGGKDKARDPANRGGSRQREGAGRTCDPLCADIVLASAAVA